MDPATIAALIGGGSSLLGGLLGSNSAKDAGKEASAAQLQQTLLQLGLARENRDLGLSLAAPYMRGSMSAFAGLMDLAGLDRSALGGTSGGSPPAGGEAGPAPGSQPGIRTPKAIGAEGGYRDDGRYMPAVPREWRGTTEQWQTFVGKYEENPEAFVNGDLRSNPASLFGGKGALYGRSGKTWHDIINARMKPAGSAAGLPTNTEANVQGALDRVGLQDLSKVPKYQFQQDPGYAFRFKEGMRALDASAAARGGLLSGGTAKAAIGYGQDMASQEYTNVFNRLAAIAGFNQVNNTQAATANAYGQAGNAAYGIGAAGAYRGSGTLAAGNSWANAINEISRGIGGWAAGRGAGTQAPAAMAGNAAPWRNDPGNGGLTFLFGD